MRGVIALSLACLLAAACAVAQPDPNRPQPDARQARGNRQNWAMALLLRLSREQTALLTSTPQGLLVLRNGVLAKYDPATLEQKGVLELFPPMQENPPAGENVPPEQQDAADLQWARDRVARMLPAAMLAEGDTAWILIGDRFFAVETRGMTITANSQLISKNPAPEVERVQQLAVPPVLTRSARDPNILCVSRGRSLMLVDLKTGKVAAEADLPAAMAPDLAGELARRLRAGAAGRQPGPGAQPAAGRQTITVVGALIRHAEGANPYWVVRDAQGNEIVLTGPKLDALVKTPNVVGKQVRVTGLGSRAQDGAALARGTLEITDFQVLPAR